jgi:putative membrane protein
MRLFAQVIAANRLEMKVTGLTHVPEYGPAVLVARHYHHLFDGVALFLSIPRRIHILVTLDWTKSTHVRRLMQRATTLARWPVVLRNDALETYAHPDHYQKRGAFTDGDINRYQRRAICDSVELLAEGRILVVFPEGILILIRTTLRKGNRKNFCPLNPVLHPSRLPPRYV